MKMNHDYGNFDKWRDCYEVEWNDIGFEKCKAYNYNYETERKSPNPSVPSVPMAPTVVVGSAAPPKRFRIGARHGA
jgi:hypothetical protein